MTRATQRQRPRPNVCHFCGQRVTMAGPSHGWVKGDAWGIDRLLQVHIECYFAALDRIRENGSKP